MARRSHDEDHGPQARQRGPVGEEQARRSADDGEQPVLLGGSGEPHTGGRNSGRASDETRQNGG